jgi:hypothetical protein
MEMRQIVYRLCLSIVSELGIGTIGPRESKITSAAGGFGFSFSNRHGAGLEKKWLKRKKQ